MASKNKQRKPAFSKELTNAIAQAVSEKAKGQGDCVTRDKIARALRGQFGISNPEMLKLCVMLAVQAGEVKDHAATRGRNGGVYNERDLKEWNRKVEAKAV